MPSALLQAGSSPPTATGYPRISLTTDATTQPIVPEFVLTRIQSGPVCDEYRRSISTRSFCRTVVLGITRDSIE
jgi:hypothetical protein